MHVHVHVHVLQMHGRSSGAVAGEPTKDRAVPAAWLGMHWLLQVPQRLCCLSRAGALLLAVSSCQCVRACGLFALLVIVDHRTCTGCTVANCTRLGRVCCVQQASGGHPVFCMTGLSLLSYRTGLSLGMGKSFNTP